jgi:hypothetical protein
VSAPREGEGMETIFHILGIVYYTVALIRLFAQMQAERKDKSG